MLFTGSSEVINAMNIKETPYATLKLIMLQTSPLKAQNQNECDVISRG
jgi:hypothetical protein